MATKINPRSITVGPLPEVVPPPMVAGGQVWRNGLLVDRGRGYATSRTESAATEAISMEEFIAQRRQREDDILDAAARGDPALLFALLTWALRCTDAPSHADLAQWMEEGRQRLQEKTSGYALWLLAAHDPPPLAPVAAEPVSNKKRAWTDERRARAREAALRANVAQRARLAEVKAPQVDGSD